MDLWLCYDFIIITLHWVLVHGCRIVKWVTREAVKRCDRRRSKRVLQFLIFGMLKKTDSQQVAAAAKRQICNGFFEKLLCLLLESLNDSLGFVLVTNCIIKCSKCQNFKCNPSENTSHNSLRKCTKLVQWGYLPSNQTSQVGEAQCTSLAQFMARSPAEHQPSSRPPSAGLRNIRCRFCSK